MIDVTFLLLVFFLCTLRFHDLEGKLPAHLPRTSGGGAGAPEVLEDVEVRLFVRSSAPTSARSRPESRSLTYRIAGRELATVEEADARLRALARLAPDRVVRLVAGEGVQYGDVVRVLDSAVRAGFSSIAFSPERPPLVRRSP